VRELITSPRLFKASIQRDRKACPQTFRPPSWQRREVRHIISFVIAIAVIPLGCGEGWPRFLFYRHSAPTGQPCGFCSHIAKAAYARSFLQNQNLRHPVEQLVVEALSPVVNSGSRRQSHGRLWHISARRSLWGLRCRSWRRRAEKKCSHNQVARTALCGNLADTSVGSPVSGSVTSREVTAVDSKQRPPPPTKERQQRIRLIGAYHERNCRNLSHHSIRSL
jgi:hypothetical protein